MAEEDVANVKVVCRFRPFNAREVGLGTESSAGLFRLARESVEVVDRIDKDGNPLVFKLTRVFDPETIQEDVYEVVAARAMNDLFCGYNASVFAYGQTGSGKSWTMFGDRKDLQHRGLVPRCTESIFATIKRAAQADNSGSEFTIGCSYCEIYQEKITDLFKPKRNDLKLREDKKGGVFVEGLSTEYVSNVADVYQLLAIGDASKKKASTLMNQDSSRSHCCFTIRLQSHDTDGNMSEALLNLIDLAGSEKVAKTQAKGQSFEEARKINLSLTTLAKVIKALSEEGTGGRVPYRESTLTRLLQNSLGGNSKTSMIVAASPHLDNIEETISSLRFAQNCAMVRNRVRKNLVLNPDQLQAMLDEARNEIRRAAGRADLSEMKDAPVQTQEGEEEEQWDFDDSLKASQFKAEFDELMYKKDMELDEARVNSQKLQVQLETKQLELDSANSRVEYLEGRVHEFEEKATRLKEVSAQLLTKQHECDTLNAKVLKLETELTNRRAEMFSLESELAQQRELGTRKESNISLRARAKSIADISRMRRSKSLMGGANPELEKGNSGGGLANFAMNLKAKAAQKKLKQLEEEKEELEEAMVDLDAELTKVTTEVANCQATIKDKEKLLQMSEGAKESLEKRIAQQEKMTMLVERSKEDVERRLEEQFARVAKLQASELAFQSSLKALEAENNEVRAQRLELEKQVADLEEKLLDKGPGNIRVPVVADSVLEQSRATKALGNMLGVFGFGFGGDDEGDGMEGVGRRMSAAFNLNRLFSDKEPEEESAQQPGPPKEDHVPEAPPEEPKEQSKSRPVSIKFW